jgi:hypothetical protein
MNLYFKVVSVFIIMLFSCNTPIKKQENINKLQKTSPNNLVQLELKDSSTLTHIKGLFYRSEQGQLFYRTFADREINGVDTLVSVEYFNGKLPQDIDPLTFEALDGWYAKDKNSVFYYRPTSGGMYISKLNKADSKTFKVINGHYRLGMDKNYVFDETTIIEGFKPAGLSITKNKEGKVIELISGKTHYKVE